MAVCGPTNLELVRSLGADAAIDYTKQDASIGGKQYDLILDAVGKRKTSALKVACKSALASGGRYISVDDNAPKITAGALATLTGLVEAHELKPVSADPVTSRSAVPGK